MAANENKVDKIVKKFNMCPHPEGGFYKRIFESSTTIHTPFGKRFSMTSINYLMTYGNFNAFHLLKQNSEVLYFHDVSFNISHNCFSKGLYLSTTSIAHLTAVFFETGAMSTPTKSRNPTNCG